MNNLSTKAFIVAYMGLYHGANIILTVMLLEQGVPFVAIAAIAIITTVLTFVFESKIKFIIAHTITVASVMSVLFVTVISDLRNYEVNSIIVVITVWVSAALLAAIYAYTIIGIHMLLNSHQQLAVKQ